MSALAAPAANKVTPDVNIAGMKAGDAEVAVAPKAGGGLVLSPLPVGGRRRSSKKGSRRRGGADEMEGARRRRKTKKGGADPTNIYGARRRRSTKKAGRR